MSLELSNEDLRTLIDLVADRLHCALRDEHMPKLENLRVRLDSELASREPGATVLKHTERVRDLVMRWRELTPRVEETRKDEELPVDVLTQVVRIWREVQKLDDPILNADYREWAEEHDLPSGNPDAEYASLVAEDPFDSTEEAT